MGVVKKKATAPKPKWVVLVTVEQGFVTAEQAVEYVRKMRIEHGQSVSGNIYYAE